ncbi:MAG: hypothetical protein GXP55_12260 [Deltaproteobacteria bacterium]|nr:hypothetical protein [Deltaproteobacteria bacterium]
MPSHPSASVHPKRSASGALAATLANFAIQDWGALAFHVYMTTRVLMAPDSPDATIARRFSAVLLMITVTALALTRGELVKNRRARALIYRIGLFAPMPGSYFALRHLLPALQPHLLDPVLHHIDIILLGQTPSVWLAQFDRPAVIEWFSFFYYSYFWLLAAVLLPSLFLDRGRHFVELMLGGFIVCACAHIGYTLVPGAGPHAAIHFAQPIHGGFWWAQVEHTVAAAGAQFDIFPSLHTGYPAFFAIHFFVNRKRRVYRYAWPIVTFFSLNIIVATLLLRWHWAIDVAAGLTLAFAAQRIAHHLSARECARGADGDPRQPVWEPLFEPKTSD